jgi:hypothetical protein
VERELTLPQLATVTGKSQDYVRQHVKRGHLKTRKDGRLVVALLSEGRRWAEEWRLPWNEAALADEAPAMPAATDRIARVRVVAASQGADWTNVLTTIRHRSGSRTSPWRETGERLPPGLLVVGADLDTASAQEFLDHALAGGAEILGRRVAYALGDRRIHFAGHGEQVGLASDSIHSPFAAHAARITEYWSAHEPAPEIAAILTHDLPWTKLAGFNLGKWSDRVGNLIVSSALEDASVLVSCAEGEICLELKSPAPFRPGTYCASIAAWLDDDYVLGRFVTFDRPIIRLPVVPDIDAFHVVLFGSDGTVLDEHANYLVREFSTQMVLMGPQLSVRDGKREVYRFEQRTREAVMLSGAYTNEIRRRQRARRSRNADASARRQGLARFPPGKAEAAVQHLAESIRAFRGDAKSVVYLGDPYFLALDTTIADGQRVFLRLVEACEGRPLRILCSLKDEEASFLDRWRKQPPALRRNVSIRAFNIRDAKGEQKSAFHDRYVASDAGEVLITHSLNGWESGGVTFCRLSSSVYLAEAASLWDTTRKDIKVVEVFDG